MNKLSILIIFSLTILARVRFIAVHFTSYILNALFTYDILYINYIVDYLFSIKYMYLLRVHRSYIFRIILKFIYSK